MVKNRKILLVVPRLNIGGAETYVMTVALSLKTQGFIVHIASAGGRLVKILTANGIQHHFVPIRLNTRFAAKMLANIIKKNNIDLIHANSAAAGIVAVKAKNIVDIPVVYTAHGVFGHNEEEMTLKKCNKIICVSNYVREYAIEKGFSAKQLRTIYTGIDLNKFKPEARTGIELRKKLNIPQDTFTLAITARIKNLCNKGHEDILDILHKYKGAENWHLLVIGKGKALWKLKLRVWRLGLCKRVHCVGHQINVQNFLNAADAIVLPSKIETFGLVLAEGMAMEKAVVTYAVGGTPEVVVDGKTGYLAKIKDLDDLYDKLSLLADNHQLCLGLGKQGRKYVAERFSCDKMMEALVQIYDEVCKIYRRTD